MDRPVSSLGMAVASKLGGADDALLEVLVGAAHYAPEEGSEPSVSTTRMFISAVDLAFRDSVAPPLQALAAAIKKCSAFELVEQLRSLFHKDDETGAAQRLDKGVSPNVEAAWADAAKDSKEGVATLERFIPALLSARSGSLLYQRLRENKIPAEQLRQEYLNALEELRKPPPPPKPVDPIVVPDPAPEVVKLPPAPERLPDAWMLSDRPLEGDFDKTDLLKFKDFAGALATILDHKDTATPFTMAINAPWGAGKTTLANMVAAQLVQRPRDRGEKPHIICTFNAWLHDDAPSLASALVCKVSRTANTYRRLSVRVLKPLPSAVLEPKHRRRRRFGLAAAVLMLTLCTSWWVGEHLKHIEDRKAFEASVEAPYQATETITKDPWGKETTLLRSQTETRSRRINSRVDPPADDDVDRFLTWLQARVVLLGAFITALAGLLATFAGVLPSASLGGFIQAPDKAAELGAIGAAREQLGELIREATWRENRLVVLVDDIERCKPPRSIEVLDAVNQLLDHPNVIVVLLGDMPAVAAAAQLKYKDLADIFVPSAGIALSGSDRGKESFGALYLQKIIQFQFDLPLSPKVKIREYMAQLATPSQRGTA